MGRARGQGGRTTGASGAVRGPGFVLVLVLVLGLAALLAGACSKPNRAVAGGYAGDDEEGSSGDEQRPEPLEVDDDDGIRELFLELGDAPRTRTCTPRNASWAIITYAPEVLDDHRVRTRELHCSERVID